MNTTIYEKYPVFYNGKYTVLYDCSKEVPALAIGIWRGFFQLKNPVFIDEMKLSLDFIKQRKIIAMISDHSGLDVVSKDVLAWLHENWYPIAAQNGLRIEAALDASSPIAKLSLKSMLDDAKTGVIQTPVFPDFQAAYTFCVKFLQEYAK